MRTVKQLIKRTLPGLFFALKRVRRQRQFRVGHGGAEYRAKQALVRAYGKRILSGPFNGMKYGDDVVCSAYLAKLVGSYEEELHGVIAAAIARSYSRVIDIGCAEGYYAIGFALRLPGARVYAFDTDPEAQRYCQNLARLNGVAGRVLVAGYCGVAELQALCGRDALVVCDCEGYEDELLDPALAPALQNTDIIVELHEFLKPALTKRLLERFQKSHSVTLINSAPRDPAAYPILKVVAAEDRPWAVREGRSAAMQWAFMQAHQKVPPRYPASAG